MSGPIYPELPLNISPASYNVILWYYICSILNRPRPFPEALCYVHPIYIFAGQKSRQCETLENREALCGHNFTVTTAYTAPPSQQVQCTAFINIGVLPRSIALQFTAFICDTLHRCSSLQCTAMQLCGPLKCTISALSLFFASKAFQQ